MSTTCKECGASNFRRLTRQTFWERVVMSRFGYYPWECAMCRTKAFLRRRGHKRDKHAENRPRV